MANRKKWEPLITPQESKDVRKWWWNKEEKVGNVYCPGHALVNDAYREGWDRIFGVKDARH